MQGKSKSAASRPRDNQSTLTTKPTSTINSRSFKSHNIKSNSKSYNSTPRYDSDDEVSSSLEDQNYKNLQNSNQNSNKNSELTELRFKYDELKSLFEDKINQTILLESVIKTNNLLQDILEQQKNIVSRIDNIEDKINELKLSSKNEFIGTNATSVTTTGNEQIPVNNKISLPGTK